MISSIISVFISIFRRIFRKENAVILGFLLLFSILLRGILFTGERMFSHDTIWFYGVFHYFAGALSNGVFPYWDPYDYCGQPFYSHLSIMHLTSPVTVCLILLNKVAGFSLLSLYHWQFIISIVISNIGVYLFARRTCRHKSAALFYLCVFLFSSFTYICLRQAGFLYSFLWAPWCMFFLSRLLDRFDIADCLGLGLFLGLSLTGYQGLFVVVFLALFAVPILLFKIRPAMNILKNKSSRAGVILCALIVLCLSLPILSVYMEKNDFVPMARMKTSPTDSRSFTDRSGAVPAEINDFRGLIQRDLAISGYFAKNLPLSEGFLYIGLLPLLLALLGMVNGKSRLRPYFIFVLIFLAMLMLGERGGVQRFVNFIFPPFRYVRHMQLLAPFFIFTLVFFSAQGFDSFIDAIRGPSRRKVVAAAVFLAVLLDLFNYGSKAIGYVTLKRENIRFDQHFSGFSFHKRREERVVTYDAFRYYRPVLYNRPSAFNTCTVPAQFTTERLYFNIFELYSALLRKERFSFCAQADKMTVADFLKYGFSGFHGWDMESRKAFIDILDVLLSDMGTRSDFYSNFRRFEYIYVSARRMTALCRQNVASPGVLSVLSPKLKALFDILIDLNIPLDPEWRSRSFAFLGRRASFQELSGLHARFYKRMALSEYLEYVWGLNHVEDFTLLLSNNYQEFTRLFDSSTPLAQKVMLEMSAVSSDIIRVYPGTAVSADDMSLRAESPRADILYIKDHPVPIAVGTGQTPSFAYKVNKYTPNSLEMECSLSSPGVLYYSQGYGKHWKAYVDDAVIPVYKANTAFMAVDMPAGEHKLKFVYRPFFYQCSLAVYYSCFLAVLYFLLRGGIKKAPAG